MISRLTLNIVAWGVAMPVMGLAASWLNQSAFPSDKASTFMMRGIEAVLLVWAAFIYWRYVPSIHANTTRALVLIAFICTLGVVGYCALYASLVLGLLIFGA
jgi:hypothetical protein